MTLENAIKIIEQIYNVALHGYDDETNKYQKDQVDALAYAKQALEKQIPLNPKRIGYNTEDRPWKEVCPNCGALLMEYKIEGTLHYPNFYNHSNHCNCGQALDWSGWS